MLGCRDGVIDRVLGDDVHHQPDPVDRGDDHRSDAGDRADLPHDAGQDDQGADDREGHERGLDELIVLYRSVQHSETEGQEHDHAPERPDAEHLHGAPGPTSPLTADHEGLCEDLRDGLLDRARRCRFCVRCWWRQLGAGVVGLLV